MIDALSCGNCGRRLGFRAGLNAKARTPAAARTMALVGRADTARHAIASTEASLVTGGSASVST
jgi:hypothetical protein